MGEPSTEVQPGGPVRTVDAGGVDEERMRRGLRETVDALEEAGIAHVIMGGLAVAALARPRWTHDIDVFVRPDDAQAVLDVLAEHGYETERTDPLWLFKARKRDVVVDVIFRSQGNIYLDEEMEARAVETTFRGERIRTAPPEDLIVIKASAHNEEGGYHWFDALALLVRPDLDWDYLLRRSRRAVRRVLSLLIYAESSDIAVPRWVIRRLFAEAELDGRVEDGELVGATERRSPRPAPSPAAEGEELGDRIRQDPRVNDLDIHASIHGGTVLLTGEVATEERRRLVGQVAEEVARGREIDNRTTVRRITESTAVEEVS